MLRLERLIDILVEFLIRTGGFGSVEVASAGYVAIRGVKIERARDNVERGKGNELVGSLSATFDQILAHSVGEIDPRTFIVPWSAGRCLER